MLNKDRTRARSCRTMRMARIMPLRFGTLLYEPIVPRPSPAVNSYSEELEGKRICPNETPYAGLLAGASTLSLSKGARGG